MKKIYLTIALIHCFSNVFAQETQYEDYYPFPYDSVFFEPLNAVEGNFSALMPLVKSGNSQDMLLPIHNGPHWIDIFHDQFNGNGRFPFKSWLGELSYESQRIQFVSAFQDTITIRTDMDLMTSDTIDYYQGNSTLKKLVIHYDNLLLTADDEIKEYSFELINESNPFFTNFDIESTAFRISKEHGILNTPSFYYFPFCQEFAYKDIAENVLDQSTLNAYKVYHLNPGNEIHSFYELKDSNGPDYTRRFYKKVCVNEVYDESLERIIQVTDIWYFKKQCTLVNMNLNYDVEYDFIQRKDTIYLNNFVGINKLLPDGFGENFEDFGVFYDEENSNFEMRFDTAASYYNDSLEVGPYLDGESDQYRYKLKHATVYSSGDSASPNGAGGSSYFYRPQYSNLNGEEWGEAYTDAFLLTLPEEQNNPFSILVKEHSIHLQADLPYESARIYNSNGAFVKYYSKEDLQAAISINDLPHGVYIFWLWDGVKSHPMKFMKQ